MAAVVIATILLALGYGGRIGARTLPEGISRSVRLSPGICGSATPLSMCKPDAGKNLEIGAGGCGPSVYVDKSYIGADSLNTITIDSGATLCFPDQTVKMDIGAILVKGLLGIGQKTHPIGTDDPMTLVTLNFTGDRPCAEGTSCPGFSKGIEVQPGGSLEMFGAKGVPPNGLNWTYLLQPAGPPKKYGKGTGVTSPVASDGEATLRLADDVTVGKGAWRADDWIAVGGTSFSPYDTEIVKIAGIQSKPKDNLTGSDIVLSNRLVHYHYGSQEPEPAATYPSSASYDDGPERNYGVDERAPVALLSRNIKLTSTISKGAANLHWGGETKFLANFTEVSVQGVEFEKFGKDNLGSYPIHFHMDGKIAPTTLVDSNSIHHSYNKCLTVHSTQGLTVSNTVCVRAVGHLFYEEIGDESNITFMHNLGMGAMSNSFDINKTDKLSRDDLIDRYWWAGDYMTNGKSAVDQIHYDGFNVPDMDATSNPTHGSCAEINRSGQLFGYTPPPCKPGQIYIEAASGFWIVNPATNLVGNIIDGCQGVGVGYWYVPPPVPVNGVELPRQPVGSFRSNRVSACYHGLFGESQFSTANSQLLHPQVGGTPAGRNLLAVFDGLTATRNRDRGVWMRDQWFVINNGRFATNRDSASLLTAGGIDGATPGDWMLTENSVFEGISQNNVDRFGPCPAADIAFSGQEPRTGCVDQTPAPKEQTPNSGDEIGKGYPDPAWNMFGYLIYDGPARLTHDRFVNFKQKPALTNADDDALTKWANTHKLYDIKGNPVNWVYEGDAALGWFQSNQSSYPTLANTSQLSFVNTDLRHQVYTELVNLGKAPGNPSSGFGDGDKNTTVIDLDGTLSGLVAADANNNVGSRFDDAHPISLNGLTFNASSNSVDECQAQGAQDAALENRPTALMAPLGMATLELQMLYPPNTKDNNPPPPYLQKQAITFTKDAIDFGAHGSQELTSRNALGVWEPKVTSGLSYTVTAAIDKAGKGDAAGIAKVTSVGLVDTYKGKISPSNPFYVRLGICYKSANGQPASASSFTITRGYHSYGGGVVGPNPVDPELRAYYNKLNDMYTDPSGNHQNCDNLVGNNLLNGNIPINLQYPATANGKTYTGCPANGITLASNGCPQGTTTATDNFGQQVCVYPTSNLTSASSLSEITNTDGTYKSLNQYYYDPGTGWLFMNVAQQNPNAIGPSPLANCKDQTTPDPSCPNVANDETYYVCPPEGCTDYVITVTDPNYKPGPSSCPDPYAAGFGAPEPPAPYHLALASSPASTVVRNPIPGDFPHYAPSSATTPMCQ